MTDDPQMTARSEAERGTRGAANGIMTGLVLARKTVHLKWYYRLSEPQQLELVA